MALDDMMGLISIAPVILRDMPLIMGAVQIVGYFFLSTFFGSIVLKGYRGYLGTWEKIAAKIGIGFFCLVMGLTMAGFIPLMSANPFLIMIQRDIFNTMIGGLISSFIMLAAVSLATHNIFDIPRMKAHLESLEQKLKAAEQVSKSEEKNTLMQKITEPRRISGIALIATLVIFVAVSFRGFPDMNEGMLSSLGLTQDDINELMKQLGADQVMPAGCDNLLVILQQHGDDIVNNRLARSDDQNARSLVSAQGHSPISMYELVHNGDNYILAVSDDSYMCHLREGVLCGCMDVSSFVKVNK